MIRVTRALVFSMVDHHRDRENKIKAAAIQPRIYVRGHSSRRKSVASVLLPRHPRPPGRVKSGVRSLLTQIFKVKLASN